MNQLAAQFTFYHPALRKEVYEAQEGERDEEGDEGGEVGERLTVALLARIRKTSTETEGNY